MRPTNRSRLHLFRGEWVGPGAVLFGETPVVDKVAPCRKLLRRRIMALICFNLLRTISYWFRLRTSVNGAGHSQILECDSSMFQRATCVHSFTCLQLFLPLAWALVMLLQWLPLCFSFTLTCQDFLLCSCVFQYRPELLQESSRRGGHHSCWCGSAEAEPLGHEKQRPGTGGALCIHSIFIASLVSRRETANRERKSGRAGRQPGM